MKNFESGVSQEQKAEEVEQTLEVGNENQEKSEQLNKALFETVGRAEEVANRVSEVCGDIAGFEEAMHRGDAGVVAEKLNDKQKKGLGKLALLIGAATIALASTGAYAEGTPMKMGGGLSNAGKHETIDLVAYANPDGSQVLVNAKTGKIAGTSYETTKGGNHAVYDANGNFSGYAPDGTGVVRQ